MLALHFGRLQQNRLQSRAVIFCFVFFDSSVVARM